MSSSLILGDPSMGENPMKRTVTGTLVGVLIAILVVVGFGVYGWIVPGGKTSWRQPGAIIVEKETGTRYVLLGGTLHPTLNMASAMMISGPQARVQLVSRNSLKGVPHGVPIGIAGAPHTMPAQGDILRGPWLACLGSSLSRSATDQIGLNFDTAGQAQELPADRFMFVTQGDSPYIIWRGRKHAAPQDSVPVALGIANSDPLPVPRAWLDLLPAGEPVWTPDIDGLGDEAGRIGGRNATIGQVFVQPGGNGGDQMFVLREDGLAPLNRTMFLLLQASTGVEPVQLDAAAVVAAPRSDDRSLIEPLADLASSTLEDGRGRVLCQRQAPAADMLSVTSVPVLVAPEHAALSADGRAGLRMRPGGAMVVYPVPLPQLRARPDPWFISDEGKRHHLPDQQAMTNLKLSTNAMVPIPRGLLSIVPSGPELTAQALVSESKG
jgi:type VII secretion protein EccB